MKFVKKTGEEIAAALSAKTGMRIQFTPYPRNVGRKYDLELKNDDLYNALNWLSNRGTVRFEGSDFYKFRELRKQVRGGKRFSVNLLGMTAQDAVVRLAFASGKRFHIRSGDPTRVISLSMQDATLNEILDRLEETADVRISK